MVIVEDKEIRRRAISLYPPLSLTNILRYYPDMVIQKFSLHSHR